MEEQKTRPEHHNLWDGKGWTSDNYLSGLRKLSSIRTVDKAGKKEPDQHTESSKGSGAGSPKLSGRWGEKAVREEGWVNTTSKAFRISRFPHLLHVPLCPPWQKSESLSPLKEGQPRDSALQASRCRWGHKHLIQKQGWGTVQSERWMQQTLAILPYGLQEF